MRIGGGTFPNFHPSLEESLLSPTLYSSLACFPPLTASSSRLPPPRPTACQSNLVLLRFPNLPLLAFKISTGSYHLQQINQSLCCWKEMGSRLEGLQCQSN